MEYNGILIVCNKVAIFIYKKKRGMNPLYLNIALLNKIYITKSLNTLWGIYNTNNKVIFTTLHSNFYIIIILM